MAESTKKTGAAGGKNKKNLVDPVYQKFRKSVIRALGTNEFYEFFMDSIARADNEFQFSNRWLEKAVDLAWVDAIESTLEAFQNILSLPRRIIQEEELIVNVANAKKAGSDVVQHLAQHASLVEKFDETSGDVQPSRLMQKYREDTIGLYENRLVFTTLESAFQFVKIRHDALFSAMGDEFGAKLKVRSDMSSAIEAVHLDMFLHIKKTDNALQTDEKNRDVFERISRIYRILSVHMNSQFAQELAKLPRIKGPITKTNVLKKNQNYHKILELFEFLHGYTDIGYTIRVIEQNPRIDETFQTDIYHNILFNYLILKSYLENEQDRQLEKPFKQKKRTLKPKFIKEIIEELTEDYDLPDVEIRKVLIEELTKEQLMQEEAEERLRLVEEQEQRRKEEQERLRKEQEAEQERLRKEKEAEEERIRQEKEAEEERARYERMVREQEDRRRSKLFREELAFFQEHLAERMADREKAFAKKETEIQDFADAVILLEEAEERRKEAILREKKRRKEEKERLRRERLQAEEQARHEEELRKEKERIAQLAEQERLRQEEEALQAQRREEELLLEQERKAQIEKDMVVLQPYFQESILFINTLQDQLNLRAEEEIRRKLEQEQWEQERRAKRAARLARKGK